MPRITLVFVLSLLLLVIIAGGVTAQDMSHGTLSGSARIHTVCENPPCEGFEWRVNFTWSVPQPPPDGYRLDYAINGKWQSYKKANTPSKGTIFISPEEFALTGGYSLRGVYVSSGKTICFRVKARYKNKKDGPWSKLCLAG